MFICVISFRKPVGECNDLRTMVWQLTYQNTPALKNTYVFQSVTASDLCRQYLIEPQFELQEYGKKVINRLGFKVCIILYISSGFPYFQQM